MVYVPNFHQPKIGSDKVSFKRQSKEDWQVHIVIFNVRGVVANKAITPLNMLMTLVKSLKSTMR